MKCFFKKREYGISECVIIKVFYNGKKYWLRWKPKLIRFQGNRRKESWVLTSRRFFTKWKSLTCLEIGPIKYTSASQNSSRDHHCDFLCCYGQVHWSQYLLFIAVRYCMLVVSTVYKSPARLRSLEQAKKNKQIFCSTCL